MSGLDDFLRSHPAVPDIDLREIRAPTPPPGRTVDMSLLSEQLDCCDWRGFSLVGHVEREEAHGVYECDNGHRWVLVYDAPLDEARCTCPADDTTTIGCAIHMAPAREERTVVPDPCVVCNDTGIDLHVMALGGGTKPCIVCHPPPHHNHDAEGIYANCPACGTVRASDERR